MITVHESNLVDFTMPPIREMTADEYREFGLPSINFQGDPTKLLRKVPFFEGVDEVWAQAIKKDTPILRFYDCGTNDLRIFKYVPLEDKWYKVEFRELQAYNLYGLLWQFGAKISHLQIENQRLKEKG